MLYLAANDPKNNGNSVIDKNKDCICKYCASPSRTPGGAVGNNTFVTEEARAEAHAEARMHAEVVERLGEQEMVGWVARKAELVWVWTGEEKDLSAVIDIADSELWAAGVVLERPFNNPPFRFPQSAGGFVGINAGGAAPWEGKKEEAYKIQLLGALKNKPGDRLERVQQHFIRPWLARPDFIKPPEGNNKRREHPSVNEGRRLSHTFSLFEFDAPTKIPVPAYDQEIKLALEGSVAYSYNGMFFGAEKIFVGEPIRIIDPKDPSQGESVMVVEQIFTLIAPIRGRKDQCAFRLVGNVYYQGRTVEDRARMVSPETFAQLPPRMRHGDPGKSGPTVWCPRNKPGEMFEIGFRQICGRWYEPQAVSYWMYPDEDAQLATAWPSNFTQNRGKAIGWSHFNDIDILSDPSVKKVPTAMTVDQMNKLVADREREKKKKRTSSPLAPPSSSKSRMARAVTGDDETDEEMDDGIAESDAGDAEQPSTQEMAIR